MLNDYERYVSLATALGFAFGFKLWFTWWLQTRLLPWAERAIRMRRIHRAVQERYNKMAQQ